MSPDDPRHGTDAGYQAHYRENEQPCDPCAEARLEFMRQYRKATGYRDAKVQRRIHQQCAAYIRNHDDITYAEIVGEAKAFVGKQRRAS